MEETEKTCWVCQATLRADDLYCWRCGHEYECWPGVGQNDWDFGCHYTAVHTNITNIHLKLSAAKACPECSYELQHRHQRFCPGCGRALTWTCLTMWRGGFICTRKYE